MARKTTTIVALAALISIGVGFQIGQSKAIDDFKSQLNSKDDIQEIITKFISENPKLILDSVEKYYAQLEEEQNKKVNSTAANVMKSSSEQSFPTYGSSEGENTIVVFSDYNCGYCKQQGEEINKLLSQRDDVRVIIKEFPIRGQLSNNIAVMMQALYLSPESEKFEVIHNDLLSLRQTTQNEVNKVFANHNVNFEQIKPFLQTATDLISQNQVDARKLGLNGTPALIINGQFFGGRLFKSEIEEKLQ